MAPPRCSREVPVVRSISAAEPVFSIACRSPNRSWATACGLQQVARAVMRGHLFQQQRLGIGCFLQAFSTCAFTSLPAFRLRADAARFVRRDFSVLFRDTWLGNHRPLFRLMQSQKTRTPKWYKMGLKRHIHLRRFHDEYSPPGPW